MRMQGMLKYVMMVGVMCMAWAVGSATPPAGTEPADTPIETKVSLITIYPGSEVYELYGHTELRVRNGDSDMFYNYGLFDFFVPGFAMHFIAGQTDYVCGAFPYDLALSGYAGRKVVEQELALTPQEAANVRDYLRNNVLPENATYRYKFLSNNCATRPRDIIEKALGGRLHYTSQASRSTYRDMLRGYNANYAWEEFGIDLALGSSIDTLVTLRQEMFSPMKLMQHMTGATVDRDGVQVPLVSATRVLVEGSDKGLVKDPTPFILSPLFFALLLLIITLLITRYDVRRGKASRWYDVLLYTLYGLWGIVLFFLIFISTHEATSPNFNGLWLHPFYLLIPLLMWFKRCRKFVHGVHRTIVLVLIFTLLAWPLLPQVANVAFFPLMVAPLVRSIGNLLIARKQARRGK